MTNSSNIVSFTFDELLKDVNYDRIFLFVLSYEYNMNFNQIMTLFNFSTDIFWTYINTLRNMLKLGDRKAMMLKHSARKIYFKWLGSNVELTEKEEEYFNFLSIYLNDSFYNGNECIHMSKIDKFPLVAHGAFVEYRSGKHLDIISINNAEELIKYIDSISSIDLDGENYTKTSRIEFLIEKYYGDLSAKEIKSKTVKDLIAMMDRDAIQSHNQELIDKANALTQRRAELVYRRG